MKNLNTKAYLSQTAQSLTPYQWETDISNGALRFDTNTLPSTPPSLGETLCQWKKYCPINEYMNPSYTKLKKLIARYEDISSDMVTVTNSGDEAIDILAKTFLDPGDRFLTTPPTYEMFFIQCKINQGKPLEVPLKVNSFTLATNKIISQANSKSVKLIFLCSPNNPTANTIPYKVIEEIVRKAESIVVVDEVYREFSDRKSVSSLIDRFNNIVILRSFSKFAGMAGARVGYLIARPDFSKLFEAIRFPMGVSYFSYKLAESVLEKDREWIKKQANIIIAERKKLSETLESFGFYVYPSEANFLLVHMGPKVTEFCQMLKNKNIIIRDRRKMKYLDGCVRITVRTASENTKLINALKEVLDEI